ncbi:MAG: Glu-tRNA(Gln) amidotransferase subunit GatD [Candidatus Hadarchaeales archaeon]
MFGYSGELAKLLSELSIKVGDLVRVESGERVYEGILMPRTELGDPTCLVLKLPNGYNIGVRIGKETRITKLGEGEGWKGLPPPSPPDPSKPLVRLVGTGGTIASRVDYRTGGVHPAFSPEELYSLVPELAELARLETVEACSVFSEHMTPELWVRIAEKVAEGLNAGAKGVVVAHGTDTMAYTSSALSFMLKNLTGPVVLVGAQRSSDRPSTDAHLNLLSAVTVASRSDLGEVCVVMHGSMNDDYCLIHRGTRVRKCHTSRRDAFVSINEGPLGMVKNGEVKMLREYRKRGEGRVEVDGKLEPKVLLLKVTPGMGADLLLSALELGYKGIVLEGTGLGHAPETLFPALKRAEEEGIPVVMTSQCLWGRVNLHVYSTGRDLLKMGVIPAEDMLPEVAYVKLMWVLGHTREPQQVRRLMLQNLAGELSPRSPPTPP